MSIMSALSGPSGGIGRHAALKMLCLRACRFESDLGYHLPRTKMDNRSLPFPVPLMVIIWEYSTPARGHHAQTQYNVHGIHNYCKPIT